MGNHYIPQFYLKGFATSTNPSQIWVYEKGNKVYCTNIENIAQEGDFYTEKTETLLANKIDDPAKKVFDKIKRQQHIDQREKALLSDFMTVLIKRVPKGKKLAEKWFYENEEKQFRENLKENIAIHDSYKIDPKDIWEMVIPPEQTSQMSHVLQTMTWVFFVSEKPSFATSDNPVFFFRQFGIGKPYSEVSFPISKNIMLWATWHSQLKEEFYPIREHLIREFNQRTIGFATKLILYHEKAIWIEKYLEKPELKPHKIILSELNIKN